MVCPVGACGCPHALRHPGRGPFGEGEWRGVSVLGTLADRPVFIAMPGVTSPEGVQTPEPARVSGEPTRASSSPGSLDGFRADTSGSVPARGKHRDQRAPGWGGPGGTTDPRPERGPTPRATSPSRPGHMALHQVRKQIHQHADLAYPGSIRWRAGALPGRQTHFPDLERKVDTGGKISGLGPGRWSLGSPRAAPLREGGPSGARLVVAERPGRTQRHP